MLDINQQIARGITFIRLEGELTTTNYFRFAEKINDLLYNQGMLIYVFNLKNVKKIDSILLESFQNKLTEIFLKCGSVALCGISDMARKRLGERKDNLFYITNEQEAFQYISI